MPVKIRQLKAALKKAGFAVRPGKGNHKPYIYLSLLHKSQYKVFAFPQDLSEVQFSVYQKHHIKKVRLYLQEQKIKTLQSRKFSIGIYNLVEGEERA